MTRHPITSRKRADILLKITLLIKYQNRPLQHKVNVKLVQIYFLTLK